jgi:hypothetical protein
MTTVFMKKDERTDLHTHYATSIKSNLAIEHIETASFLLKSYSETNDASSSEKHISKCVLIMSAFFIEGIINDVCNEIDNISKEKLSSVCISDIRKIKEKSRTDEKYKSVFEAIKGEEMDLNHPSFEMLNLIMSIRNYYAHPKPDEIFIFKTKHLPQKDLHNLEKSLKHKFKAENKNDTFLGNILQTSEFAKFILNGCIDFYFNFFKETNLKPQDINHNRAQ